MISDDVCANFADGKIMKSCFDWFDEHTAFKHLYQSSMAKQVSLKLETILLQYHFHFSGTALNI